MRARDRHRVAARPGAALWRELHDAWRLRQALLAGADFVAPLLLVVVERAVDQLVVVGAIRRLAERFAVFGGRLERPAPVGDLLALRVVPGVQLGVGDRLAV